MDEEAYWVTADGGTEAEVEAEVEATGTEEDGVADLTTGVETAGVDATGTEEDGVASTVVVCCEVEPQLGPFWIWPSWIWVTTQTLDDWTVEADVEDEAYWVTADGGADAEELFTTVETAGGTPTEAEVEDEAYWVTADGTEAEELFTTVETAGGTPTEEEVAGLEV